MPERVLARLEQARDPEADGLEMALEIIARLKTIPRLSGVHFLAIAWESVIPHLVEDAGLLPSPSRPPIS